MTSVPVSHEPSARLCRALAAFGLFPERATEPPREADGAWVAGLPPGRVALITGPSGSGKSTLLRAARESCLSRGWTTLAVGTAEPEAPLGAHRAVIDLLEGPLGSAIASLARAGLGEAALLARTPRELSEGERFRLRLAMGLHRARRLDASARPVLLVDELASTLDRVTARTVCLGLSRWAAREHVRVIAATAHDDVAAWLDPAVHTVLRLGAPR